MENLIPIENLLMDNMSEDVTAIMNVDLVTLYTVNRGLLLFLYTQQALVLKRKIAHSPVYF